MQEEPIEVEFEPPEHLCFNEARESRPVMHRGGQLWIRVEAVPKTKGHSVEKLPHEILEHLRPCLERFRLSLRAPLQHHHVLMLLWKDSEIEGRMRTDSLTQEQIVMLAEQLQSIPSITIRWIKEFRTLGTWGRNIREAEWHVVDGKLVRVPSPHPRHGGHLSEIAVVPLVRDGAMVYALVTKEELLKDPHHPNAFWSGASMAEGCEELKTLKVRGVSLVISSHPLYKDGDWSDYLTELRELRSHQLNPNVVYFESTGSSS